MTLKRNEIDIILINEIRENDPLLAKEKQNISIILYPLPNNVNEYYLKIAIQK